MKPQLLYRGKVGQLPDRKLVEALHRRHPRVRIMWAENIRRWVLVQVDPEPMLHLMTIQRKDGGYLQPSLENTVYLLDSMHPRNFRSHFHIERFLMDIDEMKENKEVDRRAKDAVQEGSSELYKALKGRIVVPRL